MITQFDAWLDPDGPVALTLTQALEPAFGQDSTIFPPTFAPPEDRKDEKPSYVIDTNGTCLIDSLGAQANRLEPIFKKHADLTPKFSVTVGDREVDLLDAGHRAADAVVRFSDQWSKLRDAFIAYRDRADATPLAKIAPTSLVFGAWDSRDTGAKIPRLVEATVRAYGVERLTRAAQYFATLEKEDVESMDLSSLGQKTLSELGISDSPAGRGPGGVVAKGGIRREALLNLVALRSVGVGNDVDATRKLQRYILGLSLVALSTSAELYLRQGCLLVGSQAQPATQQVVWRTGKRDTLELEQAQVLGFARAAAAEFGVGPDIQATFDPKLVKGKADQKSEAKKAKAKTAKV